MKLARLLVLVTLVAYAPVAHAQSAAAEAEFIRAKKLEQEGNLAEACAAYAKSYQLEPVLGSLYNLARCYEATGKTASAWARFREVAQRDATNPTRKKLAGERAANLEKRLIKLLITVRGAVPGLKITRNDVDVSTLVGIEEPVDPGRYHVVARADGYKTMELDVEASGEGTTLTVEIPPLEKAPAPPPPKIPDGHIGRGGDGPPSNDAGRGRRIAGYAVTGAGVAALGVGVVFGLKAKSTWADAQGLCPLDGGKQICETQADKDRFDDLTATAKRHGNISTGLVAGGLVAVAAGTYLWLFAPKGGERAVQVTPHVGSGEAGLVIGGRF